MFLCLTINYQSSSSLFIPPLPYVLLTTFHTDRSSANCLIRTLTINRLQPLCPSLDAVYILKRDVLSAAGPAKGRGYARRDMPLITKVATTFLSLSLCELWCVCVAGSYPSSPHHLPSFLLLLFQLVTLKLCTIFLFITDIILITHPRLVPLSCVPNHDIEEWWSDN